MAQSIYRENNELFHQLREFSIAYCQYVDKGGTICRFTDEMVNDTIDAVMKIKANRDFVYGYMGKEIPKYDKEGNRKQKKVRSSVSESKSKASKVQSEQGNGFGHNLVLGEQKTSANLSQIASA